jgi:lipoprotein LpqH
MLNRIAAVTIALSVAVLGACTPRPQTPLGGTASVTVNGNDAKFQIVKCTQVEWYRTIDIGGNFSGATIAVDERAEPVTVTSVHIRNLSGFTGMYSQGDGDDAKTSLSSGKFTITGTAHGSKADNPNEPATATFKIVVTC